MGVRVDTIGQQSTKPWPSRTRGKSQPGSRSNCFDEIHVFCNIQDVGELRIGATSAHSCRMPCLCGGRGSYLTSVAFCERHQQCWGCWQSSRIPRYPPSEKDKEAPSARLLIFNHSQDAHGWTPCGRTAWHCSQNIPSGPPPQKGPETCAPS